MTVIMLMMMMVMMKMIMKQPAVVWSSFVENRGIYIEGTQPNKNSNSVDGLTLCEVIGVGPVDPCGGLRLHPVTFATTIQFASLAHVGAEKTCTDQNTHIESPHHSPQKMDELRYRSICLVIARKNGVNVPDPICWGNEVRQKRFRLAIILLEDMGWFGTKQGLNCVAKLFSTLVQDGVAKRLGEQSSLVWPVNKLGNRKLVKT